MRTWSKLAAVTTQPRAQSVGRALAVGLSLLTVFGPISMDLYLPVLPALRGFPRFPGFPATPVAAADKKGQPPRLP